MESIIKIRLGKTRSKQYKNAVSLLTSVEGYEKDGDDYRLEVQEIMTFLRNENELSRLIDLIYKWKNVEVQLFGKRYRYAGDYFDFIDRLKEMAGKYALLIESINTEVGINSVTMEDLPLPIVYYPGHYGAFFAFSEDIGTPLFFCECEKKPIENYIKLRTQKPLKNYVGEKTYPLGGDLFPSVLANKSRAWSDSPNNHIRYKKDICFACNKAIPKLKYCLPMYGDTFEQKYGWYKKQEMLRMGVDTHMMGEVNVLPDECPPDIYDDLMRLNRLWRESKCSYPYMDKEKESKILIKSFERTIANNARLKLGFKRIGESWISETMMFQIIENIYSDEKAIRHYHPDWLEGLELDLYLPGLKMAFEYQGIQHFEPIEHWGGITQLKKQQEHDKKKKEICKERGVLLICINYDEDLTKEHILARINEAQLIA